MKFRDQKLVKLYSELSELTSVVCAGSGGSDGCKVPHSCCHSKYCHLAKEWAKWMWDQELEPLPEADRLHPDVPFLSKSGCIVAPHLRPLCTAHACRIAVVGHFFNAERDSRYWQLRNEADKIEKRKIGEKS